MADHSLMNTIENNGERCCGWDEKGSWRQDWDSGDVVVGFHRSGPGSTQTRASDGELGMPSHSTFREWGLFRLRQQQPYKCISPAYRIVTPIVATRLFPACQLFPRYELGNSRALSGPSFGGTARLHPRVPACFRGELWKR